MSQWYNFMQYQPGGFLLDDIPKWIIIEADDPDEANMVADMDDRSPIYFDGVASEIDCDCCGDRWRRRQEVGRDSMVVAMSVIIENSWDMLEPKDFMIIPKNLE